MAISYRVNHVITVPRFIDLLERSGLAERRPVHDKACMQGMLNGGNLQVTAWDGMKLVGIARSMTDFHYACYLSDLAVDRDYQRRGIGRELIARSQRMLGERCRLILLSAPAAVDYYPHLGFQRHDNCWTLEPGQRLSSESSPR